MRATAGVKSYMSAKLVHDSWVQQSDCVRNEWDKWQIFYGSVRVYFIPVSSSSSTFDPNNIRSIIDAQIQDDNVPQSAKDVDIADSYDLWMTQTIQQFNDGLDDGMHNMIDLWNQVYGQNNPVNVSSFLSPWPCKLYPVYPLFLHLDLNMHKLTYFVLLIG